LACGRGSRGRDGGGGDDGGDDCADGGSPALRGTGSAGGRRGRLRLAASAGPTVRADFGAYFNGPELCSRSRVLILPSKRNATQTLTLSLNAYALERVRTHTPTHSNPRNFSNRAGFRQVFCRAREAREAMIRCCSDDARPTRRKYMSAADV